MQEERPYDSLLRSYSNVEPFLREQVERITHSSYATEDILQEALARGLQKSIDDEIKSPAAWLRRVTYNLAVDYFRRKKPMPLAGSCSTLLDPISVDENTSDYTGHVAEGMSLENIIQCLPNHYAKIITLHYRDGVGYREIGKQLDISESVAKGMACKARAQLRRRFREQH